MTSPNSCPIPQPPPSLFLGNVPDIDPSNGPASFQRLAEIYGEIYYLDLPGRQGRTIVVSSYDTINDCCDASRFEKPIDGTLKQVRALTGDGLFTAYPGEKVPRLAMCDRSPLIESIGLGRGSSTSYACVRTDRYSQGMTRCSIPAEESFSLISIRCCRL